MIAIRANGLRVQKNKHVILNSIDLNIAKGRLVGLIGPSGSGKTTLMRSIVGVQQYDGKLQVLGQEAGSSKLRIKIGYVSQSPALYGDISVRENLKYFATVLRANDRQVDTVISSVELDKFEDAIVDTLSGGQRARVNLAVALLGNPDLLVLDEPTVGLDPILRNNLWKLFHKLASDGKTLIISSHVMDEADRCDDVVLLRDGEILWNDTRKKLLGHTDTESVGDAFVAIISEAKNV